MPQRGRSTAIPSTPPLITAHDGCQGTTPNSLESVAASITAGADVVEIDVRFLSDGTPVLSHDLFPADLGDALVRLEKVVSLILPHTGVRLNMDMKEPQRARTVLPHVAPLLAERRVFATGLPPKDIPVFQRECPGVPFAVDQPNGAVRFKADGGLRALVKASRDLGAFALNLDYRCVSRRLFAVCAAESFPVYVWTVDSARAMRRMVGWGASSITTRRVVVLARLVR
jgi:glycerophosphoryl diester phosphodiesterase